MQRQERIYDRTQSVRAALAFDTSPRTPPPSTPDRSSFSWSRQLAVAAYTGQVIKEMCRRGYVNLTRFTTSCFVAVDLFYVRCFNSRFPATFHQRRRMTPVLALLLLLVAATVVRFVVTIPHQYYNLHYRPRKPTDDTIHAHILVDVAPGQHQANKKPPHLRGDTFFVEPWTGQCKGTVHGLVYATDARGVTCKRSSLLSTGCCSDDLRFSCQTCDVEAPHCCAAYERCVSCCMGPTNVS